MMSTPKVSQKNSQQRTLSSFFTVTKPLPLNEKSSNNAEETSVKRPVSDLYEHADAGKLDLNLKEPKKVKTYENSSNENPTNTNMKYLKKFPTMTKTLCSIYQVGTTWLPAVEKEFGKPYFKQLNSFVEKERNSYTIYPKVKDVFSWTTACDLKSVKVVILGQDPYHCPNQAHGLCFSVLPGVDPPPSLLNMYKELATDIPGFQTPDHGYLMGWAVQGVLLLNSVLTVRARTPNSHKDQGWEQLTDTVINYLNANSSHLVFMLWGSYAQKKGSRINQKKHLVLKAVHPSPLAAYRGFFGCSHFSKANAYLKSHQKRPIDWNYLPQEF